MAHFCYRYYLYYIIGITYITYYLCYVDDVYRFSSIRAKFEYPTSIILIVVFIFIPENGGMHSACVDNEIRKMM